MNSDQPVSSAPPVPPEPWWLRALDRITGVWASLCLAGVLLFTASQVLDRYVLKSSFNAHDQLARIALVALTFVGIALGIRDRVNVRIEVLAHLAPAWLTRVAAGLLSLLTWGLALAVFVSGLRLLEIGATQPILGTPFSYRIMYGALLLGMGALLVFLMRRALACLRRRVAGKPLN